MAASQPVKATTVLPHSTVQHRVIGSMSPGVTLVSVVIVTVQCLSLDRAETQQEDRRSQGKAKQAIVLV
jgi:hypothetical protein